MTDYNKTTDFGAKDALATGNALKVVKGVEHEVEYLAIEAAIATKADTLSATHTGTTVITNLTLTNSITGGTIDGGSY